MARGVPKIFSCGKTEGAKAESGVKFLRRGQLEVLGAVLEPGLRVTSHQVNDFGRVGSGRVGSGQVRSRVSVTDPVSDQVFVVFVKKRFIVAFGKRIRYIGICGIAVVLN